MSRTFSRLFSLLMLGGYPLQKYLFSCTVTRCQYLSFFGEGWGETLDIAQEQPATRPRHITSRGRFFGPAHE